MKFIKYPSLTNHYQLKHVEQCLTNQIDDEWQVFEKLHGSNFALYVSSEGIQAASRNKLLTSEDKFHGFQDIIEEYREALTKLWDRCNDFIIYGELYGSNIQKEINYGDKPMFRAFDIYLYHVDAFLSPQGTVDRCSTVGIPTVSPLFKGTLKDCLEFNPSITSGYSSTNDMAEGVVIKPCIPFVLSSGSMPWIKNKTEAFLEKKSVKVKKVNTSHDPFILATYLAYVCDARLNNVKSKMTEEEMTIPNLANTLFQDVLEDITKEGIEWDRKYQKAVLSTCFKLVRESM